jgi:hypothetical protein
MTKYVVAAIGAIFVVGLGRILSRRTLAKASADHLEHQGAQAAKPPADNA